MKNKILFMYYNNKIIYSFDRTLDHREWFLSIGGKTEDYDNLIRGFILDGKVVFYKGEDFRYDNEVIECARRYGKKIRDDFNDQSLDICCGVIPGRNGDKWESIMTINDDELLDEATPITTSPHVKERSDISSPLIDLKNDYKNGDFINSAIKLTKVTLVVCIISKIILILRKRINLGNFLEIVLIVAQVGLLLATMNCYKKKDENAKYLSIFAAASLVLSFDLLDIVIGVIYFLFSVDENYTKKLMELFKKIESRVRNK